MIEIISVNQQIRIIQAKTLQLNACLIECENYLCLIDTLLLPKDIKAMNEYIHSLDKPLKYIINTHWHSDHCFGNKTLAEKDSLIIAHQNHFQTLKEERQMLHPEHNHHFKSENLAFPQITFSDSFSFTDELHYQIIYTPGHSFDAACIYLEEFKLLIAGDTILGFPQNSFSVPYFYWGDEEIYLNSLNKLLSYHISTIIPGHSSILSKEIIPLFIDYLNNLINKKNQLLTDNPNITYDNFCKKLSLKSCLPASVQHDLWVPEMHTLNCEKLFLTYFQDKNLK